MVMEVYFIVSITRALQFQTHALQTANHTVNLVEQYLVKVMVQSRSLTVYFQIIHFTMLGIQEVEPPLESVSLIFQQVI